MPTEPMLGGPNEDIKPPSSLRLEIIFECVGIPQDTKIKDLEVTTGHLLLRITGWRLPTCLSI